MLHLETFHLHLTAIERICHPDTQESLNNQEDMSNSRSLTMIMFYDALLEARKMKPR